MSNHVRACKERIRQEQDRQDQNQNNAKIVADIFKAIYAKDRAQLRNVLNPLTPSRQNTVVNSLIMSLRGTEHWKEVKDMRWFPMDCVSPLEAAMVTEGAQECVAELLASGADAKRCIYVDISIRAQHVEILCQYGCTREDFLCCNPYINNLR